MSERYSTSIPLRQRPVGQACNESVEKQTESAELVHPRGLIIGYVMPSEVRISYWGRTRARHYHQSQPHALHDSCHTFEASGAKNEKMKLNELGREKNKAAASEKSK